jgi:predicted MFS family arabinose efflux permease
MVFLVKDTLGASSGAYGAAMTAFGVGMVGGSLLVVRHPEWRPERILLGSFTATAVSTGALSVAPSMPVVYSAQIVGGAGNGLDVAAQTTLVQRRTPPAMLGRMAGAMNSAVAVGFVFAYLGGGALVEATSPRMAFAVATIGTVGALLVARPVWRAPVTAAT